MRYAVPHAFDSGLRLQRTSDILWKSYGHQVKELTNKTPKTMTMKVCITIVTALLDSLMEKDTEGLQISQTEIDKAVAFGLGPIGA